MFQRRHEYNLSPSKSDSPAPDDSAVFAALSAVRYFVRSLRYWLPLILLLSVHSQGSSTEPPIDTLAKTSQQHDRLARFMTAVRDYPTKAKVIAVNDFFNQQLVYQNDTETWGQKDYWSTPREALNKQRGDCEDYSLAKYFTLSELGIAKTQMRMVYVQASGKKNHMVLALYLNGESDPFILDNIGTEIVPMSQRTDLQPHFSFNELGLWVGLSRDKLLPATAVESRLLHWRQLLAKVQRETNADHILAVR